MIERGDFSAVAEISARAQADSDALPFYGDTVPLEGVPTPPDHEERQLAEIQARMEELSEEAAKTPETPEPTAQAAPTEQAAPQEAPTLAERLAYLQERSLAIEQAREARAAQEAAQRQQEAFYASQPRLEDDAWVREQMQRIDGLDPTSPNDVLLFRAEVGRQQVAARNAALEQRLAQVEQLLTIQGHRETLRPALEQEVGRFGEIPADTQSHIAHIAVALMGQGYDRDTAVQQALSPYRALLDQISTLRASAASRVGGRPPVGTRAASQLPPSPRPVTAAQQRQMAASSIQGRTAGRPEIATGNGKGTVSMDTLRAMMFPT